MWQRKLQNLLSEWIIVEPIIILYILSNAMVGIPTQNIYLAKFTNNTGCLEEAEKLTDSFIRDTTILYAGLSALVMLVMGPLSDKYGRKYGLLWSVAFTGLSNAVFGGLYFLDQRGILHIEINYYYIPAVLLGLGGANYAFFLQIFSYVGDLSSAKPETRLRRFTLSETALGFGVISGYCLGSIVVQELGDLYIFIICGSSNVVAFVYGLLRVKNIIPDVIGNNNENEKVQHNQVCHFSLILFSLEESSESIQGISCYTISPKRGF